MDREKLQETLEPVLGGGFEFLSHWRRVEFAPGYDWDIYPEDIEADYVKVKYDDPDSAELRTLTRWLTVAELLKAYKIVGSTEYGAEMLTWGDAISSDAVMQTAVFGEVVYC